MDKKEEVREKGKREGGRARRREGGREEGNRQIKTNLA